MNKRNARSDTRVVHRDLKAAYALSQKLACLDRPDVDEIPHVVDAESLLGLLVLAADAQGRYYADPPSILRLFLHQIDDSAPDFSFDAEVLKVFKWRDELIRNGDITVAPLAENCYGGTELVLTIQHKHRFRRWENRPPIPKALREAVYERDGYTCLHCGTTENLSIDHIHPWSKGGEDTLENFQTLCRPCNSRKGARV